MKCEHCPNVKAILERKTEYDQALVREREESMRVEIEQVGKNTDHQITIEAGLDKEELGDSVEVYNRAAANFLSISEKAAQLYEFGAEVSDVNAQSLRALCPGGPNVRKKYFVAGPEVDVCQTTAKVAQRVFDRKKE